MRKKAFEKIVRRGKNSGINSGTCFLAIKRQISVSKAQQNLNPVGLKGDSILQLMRIERTIPLSLNLTLYHTIQS